MPDTLLRRSSGISRRCSQSRKPHRVRLATTHPSDRRGAHATSRPFRAGWLPDAQEEKAMKITFPAMRGQIGGRTYYSCMMQLSVIPKMFTFRDWAEFRPEDREQRILNEKRVPHIARYILDNEDGYLFSAITASYKCAVKFTPTNAHSGLGQLAMKFEAANSAITHTQHRCA